MSQITPTKQPMKAGQPIPYPPAREFVEPDWTRIPGYHGVSQADWESATWQRKHSIKNLRELKDALGHLLPDTLATSIAKDQGERATMSMLLPPHMLNTMDVSSLWEAALHAPRLCRPPDRVGQPPQGLPRQPA
jgi:lysine 2,3-aminomutase